MYSSFVYFFVRNVARSLWEKEKERGEMLENKSMVWSCLGFREKGIGDATHSIF